MMIPPQKMLRIAFLIDADNVSIDVIQQAFELVRMRHELIHVRRAYCTAESAAKHLPLFKRLSIRPIVNVSTGKNSTDIALAVDAIDLVTTERPDIVYIVSSDSDFAPLVIRLREKGCRVEGIGQKGKTGEDSVGVYDDFVDIEHRKSGLPQGRPALQAPGRNAPAKRSRRGGRGGDAGPSSFNEAPQRGRQGRGRSEGMQRPQPHTPTQSALVFAPPPPFDEVADEAVDEAVNDIQDDAVAPMRPDDEPMQARRPAAGRTRIPPSSRAARAERMAPLPAEPVEALPVEPIEPVVIEPDVVEPEPASPPARKTGRRPAKSAAAATPVAKPPAKRARGGAKAAPVAAAEAVPVVEPTPGRAPERARERAPEPAPAPPPPVVASAPAPAPVDLSAWPDLPEEIVRILNTVPALVDGEPVELNVAGERLRAVNLLAKSAPSTRLFGKYPEYFLLTPLRQPNKVRFKPPGE